jgi:predicted metal-dependent peptidase
MTDNLSAEDRIRKVRISFLRENPFFANISLYLNLIETKNMPMPTMGIDYEGNLYFDPDYVKSLTFSELKGVIAHETMHLILQHLLRKGSRNKVLWNISTDFCINQILQEQEFRLPRGVLLSDDFKDLCAEEIYDKLYRTAKKIKVHIDGQGNVTIGNMSGKQFDTHYYPKKGENGNGGDGKKDKDYKGKGEEDNPLSERELKKLEDEWKKRIVEAQNIAKSMGSMPAGLERMIGTLLEPKINWKALLYRYVTNEIISDVSYSFPHKKSESIGVYFPHTVKENVEIVVSVDSSGCLVGNTQIYTEDGIKEIKDLVNEKVINSNFNINKTDSINKKFTFTTKKLIKIRTKSGKEIICTPNHKIFVFKQKDDTKSKLNIDQKRLENRLKSGKIVEMEANELQKNDYLFTIRKINYPQNEIKMPDINYHYRKTPTPEQIENIKKLAYKHSGYEIAKMLNYNPRIVYRIIKGQKTKRSYTQPTIPEFLNKDFAELLGYICGDGNISISKNGHLAYITITDKMLENLEHYKNISQKYAINSRIWIRKDRRKKLNLFSKDFALYIKQYFPEIICKSPQRTIPQLITKAKDDIIIGFLRGFFDAEGHIGYHNIIISNTSEKLLKQSQLLLNRLGIQCYIDSSITPERYIGLYRLKETKVFHLKIGGIENMKLFYDLIGVTRIDKKEKIEDMFKKIKINMNRINIKFNDFLSLEKITSIEIIEKDEEIEVFDLEIINNHNYFANGILVHNSIGDSEVSEFLSEIVGISHSFANLNMTLIVCDAKVHDVYEIRNGFDPKDVKIHGGGGTSCDPIVKFLEENKPYVKLWIHFTDGLTELNGINPFKSLWVISKNGSIQSAEQVAKKSGNITCMKTDE